MKEVKLLKTATLIGSNRTGILAFAYEGNKMIKNMHLFIKRLSC